jgi:hypothetical protein
MFSLDMMLKKKLSARKKEVVAGKEFKVKILQLLDAQVYITTILNAQICVFDLLETDGCNNLSS